IAELGSKYRLPLPTYDVEGIRSLIQFSEPAKNLKEFLTPFVKVIRHCFVNKEAIARLTFEVVEDAALDNITHVEIRFSPECMAITHRLSMHEVMDGIIEGVQLATRRFPITVGLIVSVNRPPGNPLIWPRPIEIAKLAVKYADRGVVGFDLSGLEAKCPPMRFVKEFQLIKEAGLGVTVHAGEDSGPENIREAIEILGASRIGHGVRITQDPDILNMALDRGVCLELCPTSNVLTHAVDSLGEHPVKMLYDQGLEITVNTDDPTLCGVTLTDEYMLLVEKFGFTLDDIGRLIDNAHKASFRS
ncbi:MAG: adenosine deaminase, partial [Armatimonadota bacterium]|nr:adenosine deaminase [Armatimonadota bacterium]